MNVMLDLETLGNGSQSVIISIGAVEFDKHELYREFYAVIDPESCVKAGLKMDTSTVMWWMKQSDQARAAFNEKGVSLSTALSDFMDWLDDKALVWGNGATFDNVILDNAYRATGLAKPWKYNADRCYRTLKALYPQVPLGARSGTYHNALDDARHQAIHASKILNLIG